MADLDNPQKEMLLENDCSVATIGHTNRKQKESETGPPLIHPPHPPSHPLLGSTRFTLTIMAFFGVYHLMALRFNISMGLVCMSKDTTTHNKTSDNTSNSNSLTHTDISPESSMEEELEFSWSKPLQGAILSSFFYGYLLTQVLGGYTSDRWGGRTVLLYGMIVLSIGTLLTPVAARLHPYCVLAIRIIQGLASGFAFPSVYNIFTVWAPPQEKITLMSISMAGIPTATVTIYPLVSWLCKSGILGGWPLAFYIPGTTGLVWCLLFSQIIYNHPSQHPSISPEELHFITKTQKQEDVPKKHSVPWLDIFRSRVVVALTITHFCSAFAYYLIIINISLFIREALHIPVVYNGFLSMLPAFGMLLLSPTGKLFDLFRSKSDVSLTNLRKIFNSVAFFLPAACFLGLGLVPSHLKVTHVVVISLGLSIHQLAMTAGFYLSHSDIGGVHAGVLFGITNTFAQIGGFVTPTMVSYMTQHGSLEEWYRVFQVAGLIYIIGGFVYLVFGSSKLQPWAEVKKVQTGNV